MQIVAAMILLFVASWLPYSLVATLGLVGYAQLNSCPPATPCLFMPNSVGYAEYVTPYAAEFPVMLAKASAVWNPDVSIYAGSPFNVVWFCKQCG